MYMRYGHMKSISILDGQRNNCWELETSGAQKTVWLTKLDEVLIRQASLGQQCWEEVQFLVPRGQKAGGYRKIEGTSGIATGERQFHSYLLLG